MDITFFDGWATVNLTISSLHRASTRSIPDTRAPWRPVPESAARARRKWLVAATLTTLTLVAALGVEARAVVMFHAVTPWSTPQRLSYCGRDFYPAGLIDQRGFLAQTASYDGPQRIGRGPSGQPMFAVITPKAVGDRLHPSIVCTMNIYLRHGDGYRRYGLSGGP